MDVCICGHSERDHIPTGECRAVGCRCKHYEPVPEVVCQQTGPGGQSPKTPSRGGHPSVAGEAAL